MVISGAVRNWRLTARAGIWLMVAAWLILFSACTQKGTAPDGLLFLHGVDVYEAGPSPRVLFSLDAPVRDRAVSRIGDTIILWQHGDEQLVRYSLDGHRMERIKLPAAAVQIAGDIILARSMVFEENTGFHFSLLRWTGRNFEHLMETDLDLFPSDVVLLPGGQLLLAGVNRKGSQVKIIMLDPVPKTVHTLLSVNRADGFPRLVLEGDFLVSFISAREVTAGDLRMFISLVGKHGPSEFIPFTPGWTQKPAALMGYGFAHEGKIWLPVVLSDGTPGVCPLPLIPDPVIGDPIPDSGGVFLPLGSSGSRGDFWYLAFDPLKEGASRILTRFDGTAYTRYPLP